MQVELNRSKDKQAKEQIKKFQTLSGKEAMIKTFLKAYIQRCTIKYNLAFLQWRNINSRADLAKVESLFEQQNQLLQDLVKWKLAAAKKSKKFDGDAKNVE